MILGKTRCAPPLELDFPSADGLFDETQDLVKSHYHDDHTDSTPPHADHDDAWDGVGAHVDEIVND